MKRYKQKFKATESILDVEQNILNLEIWSNGKMIPTVRDYIITAFEQWKEYTGINFYTEEIVLIGGSGGFRYNLESDVDVNVQISKVSDEDFWYLSKNLPNGTFLPGTQHPVNYYLVTDNQAVEEADNAYDILNDEWIKAPVHDDIEVPYTYINSIAQIFTTGIDFKINEIESLKKEIEYYQGEKELANDNYEDDELDTKIQLKTEELQASKDALELIHYMVRSFRKEAFDGENKFNFSVNIDISSPNFSMNNAIYKMIESLGYFDKIEEGMK